MITLFQIFTVFILLAFFFRRYDSLYEIWYLLQINFTKKKPLYNETQLLRKYKCWNCHHGRQLTTTQYIVCYYIALYDQDASLLDFFAVFVVVVVTVIVFGNHLLGMDWLVVIPLGTIICLQARELGVDGVCRDPQGRKYWMRCRRGGHMRRSNGEPPPPPPDP